MEEYTKGPWVVEPCYRSGYTIWGGTNAKPICVVDTQDDESRYGVIRNEADAHLIATAPQLLEFAEWVLSLKTGGLIEGRAREVIAKAKGE